MKKLNMVLGIIVLMTVVLFSACKVGESSEDENIISVTSITFNSNIIAAAGNLVLTGTVQPDNATNKTIVWSVNAAQTDNAAGAVINGNTLTTTGAGTVTITATIVNGKAEGTNYTQDFIITIFADEGSLPTVDTISVTPLTASVFKGGLRIFTATVTGTNDPQQYGVNWSIDETNKNPETTINADGLLTVAAVENLTTLTVRAVSKIDVSKSGTATVTITSPFIPPADNFSPMSLENPQRAFASGNADRIGASLNRLAFGVSSRTIRTTALPVLVHTASSIDTSFTPWGNIVQDTDDLFDPITPDPAKGAGRQIVLTAINETNNAGRIGESEDGITFYFKEVDVSKNFRLTADFYVDVFGFTGGRTTLNGQEAFGIMARDWIPQHHNVPGTPSDYRTEPRPGFPDGIPKSGGAPYDLTMKGLKNIHWDGVYWNGQDTSLNDGVAGSSNMIMVGAVRGGMRVCWRTGVTDPDGDKKPVYDFHSIANATFYDFDYQPRELNNPSPGPELTIDDTKNNPDFPAAGLKYTLHLEKNNSGFVARIIPPSGVGKGVTKDGTPSDGYVLEYSGSELPSTDLLTGPKAVMKEKYYVGFFAARDAKVTITNIIYEESIATLPPLDDNLYKINITNDLARGSITVDNTNAKAGDFVTITLIPASGYMPTPTSLNVKQINGTTVSVGGSEFKGGFIMPSSDVIISGGFQSINSLIIPGSGGRTTGQLNLNKNYNASAGSPGMRIFLIGDFRTYANLNEITSQNTLGLWEDNKFHIEGFNVGFNDGYRSQGFVDVLLLYYDQPFDEEFKISARVRIKRTGGVSTSKGIHFSAYSNMGRAPILINEEIIPQFGSNQDTKGLGMFFRAEALPNFRLYFSCNLNSTTAGTSPILPELYNLDINREYIYEVARVKIDPSQPFSDSNAQYTFQLLDSKTGSPVVWRGSPPAPVALPSLRLDATTHPVGGSTIQMPETLKGSVYAGICIAGSSAEISQIKIWTSEDQGGNGMNWNYTTGTGDEPIFSTPDTVPAYVPAQQIGIHPSFGISPSVSINTSQEPHVISYNSSFLYSALVEYYNHNILIRPSVFPERADINIRFEFSKISGHNAFSIAGDEATAYTVTGVQGKTFERGIIAVDPDQLENGIMASAVFKIVARDLNLDLNKADPEYAKKQTLPEYIFRVEVTKP